MRRSISIYLSVSLLPCLVRETFAARPAFERQGHHHEQEASLFQGPSCGDHKTFTPRENAYTKAGQGVGVGWNYLLTPPFEARHKLAAAEFHNCRSVIEVGARAEDINIGKHLTGKPKTVTVIDPMIPEKCEVTEIGQSPDSIYRQIPSGLEDFHESGFDCLLALGLDCWSEAYEEALVKHARHASKVVLGRAVGWPHSEECAKKVESQLTGHSLDYRVQLDFSGNHFEKSQVCIETGDTCPWTHREMAIYSKI
jgi:hypothetical protein